MLWEAFGFWMDQRKFLPAKHAAMNFLQRWQGVAVVFDHLEPVTSEPVGLVFGVEPWFRELHNCIREFIGSVSHMNK